jgi:hypothetical protein
MYHLADLEWGFCCIYDWMVVKMADSKARRGFAVTPILISALCGRLAKNIT